MGRISIEPSALPSIAPAPPDTSARREADANWLANLRAMSLTQPHLAQFVQHMAADDIEWLYARDGALSAMAGGRWHSGCSLPRRAAAAMLAKITQAGVTGCMLAPTHAAQIEQALRRLQDGQALIIIEGDLRRLWIALRCCDFSRAIEKHRLWFAAGGDWPQELRRIFVDNPGLPTPAQSIRTPLVSEDQAADFMSRAQRVISEENQRRTGTIQALRNRPAPNIGKLAKLCLIAPSRFRLWNDAGYLLGEAIGAGAAERKIECVNFDSDDPASSSPLGLAQSAAECDAVLAANIGRAEISAAIPDWLPLITWATIPRVPARNSAGPHDALLLADPAWLALARDAGWSEARLAVARWPGVPATGKPDEPGHLAIVADTADLYSTQPFDLSTHGLLWEMIRAELLKEPFALGYDLPGYLKSRMQRLGIQEQGFQWGRFIDELIVPAFGQGIARVLAAAGLPLRIHGNGWGTIPDLAALVAGPIVNRVGLQQACHAAAALVHVWPIAGAHAMETFGRPAIRASAGRNCLLNEARRALSEHACATTRAPEYELSLARILDLLK